MTEKLGSSYTSTVTTDELRLALKWIASLRPRLILQEFMAAVDHDLV